jgi:hypothetical protein
MQSLTFREERHGTAASCLRGIREHIAEGWAIVEIRGGAYGRYLVLWRLGDEP